MPIVESELALLRHPRLAALATSAWPAWLWSIDASRMLWANAVGAAMFGAANTAECGKLRFGATDASAVQIGRLAATLPSGTQERLERLRGFGAGFGRALTCVCSRIVLPDGAAAVLVAAAEPTGPPLTLGERVRRLFADGEQPLAVFAANGTLLFATATARARLGAATTLSALGIDTIAAQALETGSASGAIRGDPADGNVDAKLDRLGKDDARVLVLSLPPRASVKAAARTGSDDAPIAERRHPLRFVWQMDADGRFVLGSNEFIEVVGPQIAAAFGRLWSEIAADLKLDPDKLLARAVATHEPWSGIALSWPLDGSNERLMVELSGLPVFDRDRTFCGYRGFGVCRDIARVTRLEREHRERAKGFIAAPERPANESSAAAAIPQNVPAAAAEAAPRAERPALSVAPASANVVPFRSGPLPEPKAPSLSPVERKAFRELAQELTARLRGTQQGPAAAENAFEELPAEQAMTSEAMEMAEDLAPDVSPIPAEAHDVQEATGNLPPQPQPAMEQMLLDRVPSGVLVYRNDSLLYANRYFLEWSGYESLDALEAAGGLNSLFVETGAGALANSGGIQPLSIRTRRGEKLPVEGRLFTVPWHGASALALVLTGRPVDERLRVSEAALGAAETENRELKAALDSARKKSDDEIRNAKREAQKANAAKTDFLVKVGHQVRTPLNAMIGFAEVIMAERFGAIGNEHYREYFKDIHAAGTHLVSLLNDLLDLSKIESGQLNLAFTDVNLNDLTQQCVGIMQPQANRERIIIRVSIAPDLPVIVVDERSLRQIVLNLLSNSIKFTGPGGQVIVSTAISDNGEAVLRVRDTGVGMSEKDIEAVLEPFHQTAASGNWGSGGTGLGLPLTKALAEANRANFSIKSAPNAGNLVEVAFPPNRVRA
jgi:signal transduction histidine kinase